MPRWAVGAALLLASLGIAAAAGAQLTVRVSALPASTPAGAAIHVAGSFNGWNPASPGDTLSRQPGGEYAFTLPGSARGHVEFKFALGAWDRVETTVSGGAVANRQVTVPSTGAVVIDASIAGWAVPGLRSAPASTASHSVSILSDSFPMPQLSRTRRIWLYLPPGYATSTRRYPVLYLQDGQNLFDAATSFAGEWGIDETLDSLHARGDRGAIVIGVDHGGSHRLDEYNPWVSPGGRNGGGEGDRYVDFLVHTLKPYVDRHLRTRPGRLDTAVGGSSAGAVIALYAALKHPDVFGRAAIFSAASWLAGDSLDELARHPTRGRPSSRLYFVSGAFETPDGQPALDQRGIVRTLVTSGHPGADIRSLTPADGKHAEWFWRREFPEAYRWLFEARRRTRTRTSATVRRRAH